MPVISSSVTRSIVARTAKGAVIKAFDTKMDAIRWLETDHAAQFPGLEIVEHIVKHAEEVRVIYAEAAEAAA